MKKSILLATTAIISAFALNANAAAYNTNINVTLEGEATLINPINVKSKQKLNFGRVAGATSGVSYTIDTSGNITASGDYAQTFGGTVQAGKIQISSVGGGFLPTGEEMAKITLLLPNKIPLSHATEGACGDITSLTQSSLAHDSTSYSYDISFGGTFTPTKRPDGAAFVCTGTAEATVVYTE
jgi:hypothetical protein